MLHYTSQNFEEEPIMLKAIVFDLDDTLYDQQRPFQQALASVWNDPAVSGHVLTDLFKAFKHMND